MNHPTREDLVAHLYGELPPERQTELTAHLGCCADCQKLAIEWRATMAELDTWQLPAVSSASPARVPTNVVFAPFWKWAVAACLVLGLGFLGGRFSVPTPDAATLRAALAPELQKFSATFDTKLAEDRRAAAALLQSLDAQRAEDYAALRRALETLAVNTEDSLESAQRQIVQLATVTGPAKP